MADRSKMASEQRTDRFFVRLRQVPPVIAEKYKGFPDVLYEVFAVRHR